MKTYIKTCCECGKPYERQAYDLDLNIGDKVMPQSWVGVQYMTNDYFVITDVTHKAEGLYFGSGTDSISGEAYHNTRIDTRKTPYVKI